MQTLKTTLAFRLASEVLAAMTAMLLFSCPASSQHKPTIRAVFETNAPLLRISPWLDLPSTKRQLSKTLAGLGDQYLGFLKWSSEDPSGSPPTEILTARLVEKPVDFGDLKSDAFTLSIEGPSDKSANPIYEKRLYGPWQEVAKDREKLKQILQRKLEEWLKNQDIRKDIVDKYLHKIAISNKIEVLEDDRLGVPLLVSEIHADSNSKMHVEFQSTLGSYSGSAELDLKVRSDREAGEWSERVQCSVDTFSFNRFDRHKGWHEDIPRVLKNHIADTLRVYMSQYERCEPGTDCSVALTPK